MSEQNGMQRIRRMGNEPQEQQSQVKITSSMLEEAQRAVLRDIEALKWAHAQPNNDGRITEPQGNPYQDVFAKMTVAAEAHFKALDYMIQELKKSEAPQVVLP